MWGQLFGSFSEALNPSERSGAFLNIDRDRQGRGKLAVYPFASPESGTWCDWELDGNDPHKAKFVIPPIKDRSNFLFGEMLFKEKGGILSGEWSIDDKSGEFEFRLTSDVTPTPPDKEFSTWTDFKTWLNGQPSNNKIYRGQSDNRWRLKTSFHRAGRLDLLRYGAEEVHLLNHYLTGILNRSFDITSAFEHGALLNLAQHHGFPTPFLDWTESPYIAAFFAFSDLSKHCNEGTVRLFIFDKQAWWENHPSVTNMNLPAPYISIHQFLPLYNSRALPQQSVVTATNVSDIEGWIKTQEPPHHKYLLKIDLPASERNIVMSDLTTMGITAASLFPGVEGTCRALKERLF